METLAFVFDNDSVSSSVGFYSVNPTCFRIPQMASGTTQLVLQRTWDFNKSDANAAWEPMYSIQDAKVALPCSDAGPKPVQVNPGDFLNLGRVRLAAEDASGSAVVQVTQQIAVEARSI